MVDTDKLRGVMAQRKKSGETVAKEIGISSKSFYNKMKSKKFNTDEMQKIVTVLGIEKPQAIEIFLS